MNKFTPGPWSFAYKKDEMYGEGSVVDDCDRLVAIACGSNYGRWSDNGEDEFEANARLIAAAPELLEASEMLITSIEGGDISPERAISAISSAIAKARGES